MSNQPENSKRCRVWSRLTCLSVAIATVAVTVLASRPRSLPTESVRTTAAAIDSKRCAECHGEIVASFEESPHARTLSRASMPEVVQRFSGEVQLADDRDRFVFESSDNQLSVANDRFPERLPIDWVFGSGRHAQTPVSLWENSQGQTEMLEHRLSWYPHVGLAATLGQSDRAGHGRETLGRSLPNATTIRCFGCHSSHVPVASGRIDSAHVQPGLGCARCHYGASEHLVAVGAGETNVDADRVNAGNDARFDDWPQLPPLDSVNRCGECHRRADEFTAEELQPDNSQLVRFASVGLVMSQCFQQQVTLPPSNAVRRLTCLTCHDPHRPAESDPDFYRQRCLECHGTLPSHVRPCSSQPPSSQCTTCHLPKVGVHESLNFSDHWIRAPAERSAQNQ